MGTLRSAPATLPALGALALFVAWATSQGGYPLTHWAPGGLIVMGLLLVAILAAPLHLSEVPRPVQVSIACLAAYTALSFLSILWAAVPGDAWEGADRTLLYLLVFILFCAWRQRGASAALLLSAWVLAMVGLAVYVLIHLDTARASSLQTLMPGGRLDYPAGYPNANAAQWLMALWPAVLLARSDRVLWPLRGLLAGGAVLLAGIALLSQSRGSIYATPVVLVLVFLLLPGRVRTLLALIPIAAGVGLLAEPVLHAARLLEEMRPAVSQLHSALAIVLILSLLVGLVFAAVAAAESRGAIDLAPARRLAVKRGIAAVAIVLLVAGVAGGLIAVGDPVGKVRHGWYTFTHGYAADTTSASRLASGLGSSRYDFYRVALDEFTAHPVVGIGADNFAVQYLRHRRTSESPRYPHSVELRTLSQAGVIGAVLALAGLLAALIAAGRAVRSPDRLAAAVAAAALGGFGYWVVHGSVDWFWEFAGLGAPAFALLGLACSLGFPDRDRSAPAPQPSVTGQPEPNPSLSLARPDYLGRSGRPIPAAPAGLPTIMPRRNPRVASILVLAACAVLALAAAGSLAAPWFSQLEVQRASQVWRTSPATAFASLRHAERLNPLSNEAQLLAGGIAQRLGRRTAAERWFRSALGRSPEDAYATLELGAILSEQGRNGEALPQLERAVELNPRDPIARESLAIARRGERIDVGSLNAAIILQTEEALNLPRPSAAA